MPIFPTTDEQIERQQAAFRAQQPQPQLRNGAAALAMDGPYEVAIELRWGVYRLLVPRLPYDEILELFINDRMMWDIMRPQPGHEVTLADLIRYRDLYLRQRALMRSLCRPLAWQDRVRWAVGWDPFRQMEAADYRELRDFFCNARTKLSVVTNSFSRANRLPLSTSWTGSRTGRQPTARRRGPIRVQVVPKAGVTMSMGSST